MIKINFKKLRQKGSKNYLWFVLNIMTQELSDVMVSSHLEEKVVLYLARKTLGFSKLKEKISREEVREGSRALLRTISEVKSKLIKNNIIINLPNKFYCLNLSGIARLYKEIFSSYYVDKESFDEIYTLSKNVMFQEGIVNVCILYPEESRKMQLKETLKANQEKREENKKKNREKRMQADLRQINEILPYIDDLCEEFGLRHHEKDWGGKERGQANNWLKACNRAGKNPKEELREICSCWKRLVPKVKDRFGKTYLNEVFSFTEYYKHRDAIGKELCMKDTWQKYNLNWVEM